MMMRSPGGVAAAALAALVYVNALDNPFVYDDHDTVVANPSLVDPSNIRFVLTHSPFRPLVNVSYAVDRTVWGADPFGFHLTNVALHALVVFLLHRFLRHALADARSRTTGRTEDARPLDGWLAFGGAALFGVHPLMSEAVGYVSGRSEVLCAVFFLAAVLWARLAMQGARVAWVAVGVFALLAALSKEIALALPIVVLAYDWVVMPGSAADRRRRGWTIFLPCLAVALLAGVYRLSVAAGPVIVEAPLLNLWTQAIVIWRYVALLGLPAGQSVMHAVHAVTSVMDPKALIAIAGLVVLAGLAIATRRTVPLVSFGIVWFLAILAPSSSVVALREGMAEHRVYLASGGLFLVLAAVASFASESARLRRPQMTHTVALGAACLVLGALTMARNQVWSSPEKLWREATVHAAGMWEPHYALGDALRASGNCSDAVAEYEAVIRLRPHHRDAHTNLGICLAQSNRLVEAEAAFRRALEVDPAFARGYTNLAALALTAGENGHARDFYHRALEIEPRNVLARMQLARIYETVFADFHSAARMCGEARALAPHTPGVGDCVERNQRLAAAGDRAR
jgi:Flp pilus assembly protein TadD